MELLERPFIINLEKGSVTDIQTSADEPLWTVNLKKAIASQLQVNVAGIRTAQEMKSDYSSSEESNTAYNTYEVKERFRVVTESMLECVVTSVCRMAFLVAATRGTRLIVSRRVIHFHGINGTLMNHLGLNMTNSNPFARAPSGKSPRLKILEIA